MCLGCKDGLIAENTAVIEVGLPSAPKLGHPAPSPSLLPPAPIYLLGATSGRQTCKHCTVWPSTKIFILNNLLQRWFSIVISGEVGLGGATGVQVTLLQVSFSIKSGTVCEEPKQCTLNQGETLTIIKSDFEEQCFLDPLTGENI